MNSREKIQVIKPGLPKGGGTIEGMGEQFAPHEFSGAASMSIPIPITSCRGMQPSLSLEYSSGNSESVYGYGWNLSLSHIVRQTSKGVPKYDDTDTFLLAGDDYLVNKLDEEGNAVLLKDVKVGNNSYTVSRYVPRVEGHFSLIDYFVNNEDSTDQFWKVTSSENTVTIFGKSKNAQVYNPDDPSKIFKWLPEEVYDDMGNHRIYSYQKENLDNLPVTKRDVQTQLYLASVQYGNNNSITDGSLVLATTETKLEDVNWHFEIVFDYGGYDIQSSKLDNYSPTAQWEVRQDPFSTYDAGFEIRTWRLLRNVLLFHQFDELNRTIPILVDQLNLSYKSDVYSSMLIEPKHIGWQLQNDPKNSIYYQTKSLPPITLGYTAFLPLQEGYKQGAFNTLADNDWDYELTDLYSEGIPGLLYADGQSIFYRRAKSITANSVTYEEKEAIAFPPSRVAGGPLHTLADVTGSGRLDLVVKEPGQNGFYEMETNGNWSEFNAFESFPSNFLNPQNQLQDIIGNGLSDLVLIDEEKVRYNSSEKATGYSQQVQVDRSNEVPVSCISGKTKMVRFANFLGAGTAQRAEITNGKVVCWPGLGYGNFGEPVTLTFPNLGEDFDISRLFLTNIDGSGGSDLAYVSPDRIDIYLNQSGNGFAKTPISISFPKGAEWSPLDKIQFADILGNGTSCLVFTKMAPTPTMYYYNFNYDSTTRLTQKPHLLKSTVNNMGASSSITYASSVQFYLQDRGTNNEWITHLPFPVNVVATTTNKDEISGTSTVGSFQYSHGYYDGFERAFRGFGFVGRTDAPNFEVNNADTKTAEASAYNQAPLVTKTWYHTGADLEEADLLIQYKKEYWQEGVPFDLPDPEFLYLNGNTTPNSLTQHGACRVLHGTVLRTEVYGNDQTPWADVPYTVTETQFKIIQVQEQGSNKYNVFRSESLQSISWDYERNTADPMVSQNFTLKTDQYGQVIESCSVHYGRVQSDQTVAQTKDQQTQTWISYETQTLVNPGEKTGVGGDIESYLLGISIENQSFEIKNLVPDATPYFTLSGIQTKIATALTVSENNKILHWERDYYYDASTQKELALNQYAIPLLHHRTEHIVFDEPTLAVQLPEIDYKNILTGDGSTTNGAIGGYITFAEGNEADNYYWNPGAFQQYENADGFYVPKAFFDPFQYPNINKTELTTSPQTVYQYDAYFLSVTSVTDALENAVVMSDFDYVLMHAKTITDANNNWSKIVTDPLGMVIVTAHGGVQVGDTVGFDVDNYVVKTPESVSDIIENPSDYLQNAATYFYYDIAAWQTSNGKTPAHSVHLNYTEYTRINKGTSTNQSIHKTIAYSDGFGRALQAKAYCDVAQEVRTLENGAVVEKMLQSSWLTSGAIVYNNKGHAIKKYEPYFAASYNYDNNSILNIVGYSSTLFYDAIGRSSMVKSAEGFFTKTLIGTLTTSEKSATYVGYLNQQLYGTLGQEKYNDGKSVELTNYEFHPSAWSSLQYDANDCSNMGEYTPTATSDVDLDALNKAKVFANTPHINTVSSLGKVVETRQLNVIDVEQDINFSTHDILGATLTETDQRLQKIGVTNFETTYNLGTSVKVVSADAGTSWALASIVGHPIYHKDSRGFEQYSIYDILHRPTEVIVAGGDLAQGALNNTVKKMVYSDTKGKSATELSNAQEANTIGNAIIAFDESGINLSPAHSITGVPLTSRQYIRSEYKKEADWSIITSDHVQAITSSLHQVASNTSQAKSGIPTAIKDLNSISSADLQTIVSRLQTALTNTEMEKFTLPTDVEAMMLSDQFVTSSTHNAIGQVLSVTDADGNIQTPTYDSLAREQSLNTTAGANAKAANQGGTCPGTTSITYNAKGQQTKEVSSNGVVTTHSYDPINFGLINIKSTRKETSGAITTLQDLGYHHDPVGNVCSVTNGAIPTTFFNNQQVEAKANYTFDSLYQLIKATGREQAGMWGNTQTQLNKEYIPNQFAGQQNNGAALQNYTQSYSYDAGGNLLTQNQTGGLSRTTTIAANNNRINTSGAGDNQATSAAYKYDVHGNMLTLSGTAGVAWNYRDNMGSATQIERSGDNSDSEYYVYDGAGKRVRKISEQLGANNSTNIIETLYAGGIEIRRKGTTSQTNKDTTWSDIWHNVKLMQGRAVSCLWRYQLPTTNNAALVSQQCFQLTDALDSSNYEVDENAQLISYQEYYPYGGTSIVTATNATEVANKYYQYSSQEKDKTGLYYYGMRYYAPWLGRWTSTDPAGTVDGLNVYAFVTGNPVSHVDVGGMMRQEGGRKSKQKKKLKKLAQPGKARVLTIAQRKKLAESSYGFSHKIIRKNGFGRGNVKEDIKESGGRSESGANLSNILQNKYLNVNDNPDVFYFKMAAIAKLTKSGNCGECAALTFTKVAHEIYKKKNSLASAFYVADPQFANEDHALVVLNADGGQNRNYGGTFKTTKSDSIIDVWAVHNIAESIGKVKFRVKAYYRFENQQQSPMEIFNSEYNRIKGEQLDQFTKGRGINRKSILVNQGLSISSNNSITQLVSKVKSHGIRISREEELENNPNLLSQAEGRKILSDRLNNTPGIYNRGRGQNAQLVSNYS